MKKILGKIKRAIVGAGAPAPGEPVTGFRPAPFKDADEPAVVAMAAEFFNVPKAQIEGLLADYKALAKAKGHVEQLGERKTLNFHEAFLVAVILSIQKPAQLVEIGTQYGKSTRRIIDAITGLGLPTQVTCFDIEDQVKWFKPGEARLVLHDLTTDFKDAVLGKIQPGAIYLDAHPYYLLKKVISEYLESGVDCVMAVHDCGIGLYNPNMEISKDDPSAIGSKTGHWERHVLAEVFGVADAGAGALDDLKTATHRLRIFPTTHGLGLIRPLRADERAA